MRIVNQACDAHRASKNWTNALSWIKRVCPSYSVNNFVKTIRISREYMSSKNHQANNIILWYQEGQTKGGSITILLVRFASLAYWLSISQHQSPIFRLHSSPPTSSSTPINVEARQDSYKFPLRYDLRSGCSRCRWSLVWSMSAIQWLDQSWGSSKKVESRHELAMGSTRAPYWAFWPGHGLTSTISCCARTYLRFRSLQLTNLARKVASQSTAF